MTTFFLVLNIFYRRPTVTFISEVQEGIQHFPGGGGGVQLFAGGSNCLFPIKTNIACDFTGGGGAGSGSLPMVKIKNL